MENEVQMLLFSLPQVPLMSISYLEEKPGSQLGIGNLEMDDTSWTLVKRSAVLKYKWVEFEQEKRGDRDKVNGWFQRFLATPQISQNYGLCQPVFTILNDCHNKTKFTTGFRRMAKSVSSISFVTLSHLHLPITVPVYSLFLFTFAPTVPLNPPLLCTHCSSVPSVLFLCTQCSSVPTVTLFLWGYFLLMFFRSPVRERLPLWWTFDSVDSIYDNVAMTFIRFFLCSLILSHRTLYLMQDLGIKPRPSLHPLTETCICSRPHTRLRSLLSP